MAGNGTIDLNAPAETDTVLEVRCGKMQKLKGLNILSGIDKTLCDGPVKVNEGGIVGDEHDYTFHGGPDKALHGYCSTHYASWQAEFPSAADHFRPGGFGENLVLARMNERNVCIGDIVSVGDSLLLQVSLPRQPCFKLNHRFQLSDFAPQTWRHSRTGWYYRVLRPGPLQAGDQVRLVERRHPEWTIERIQEYLHRDPDRMDMVERLAAIDEFGDECKGAFAARLARHRARESRAARALEERRNWRTFALASRTRESARVASLVFEATASSLLLPDPDPVDKGSHARVRLPNGLVRAYSIVDGDRNRFTLGVALDPASRGGSRFLHSELAVGDTVEVGPFTRGVPMVSSATHHVYVAGGVGVTAFLALVEALKKFSFSCTLHYAVRSRRDDVPFADRLAALGDNLVLYPADEGRRLDIAAVIRDMPFGSHINFCGPRRMMDQARSEVLAAGLADKDVHYEAFEADLGGDPFEAVVTNRGGDGGSGGGGGITLHVGPEETLLETLQRQFGRGEIASSCEVGNCGTCKIAVKSGRVDHRGTGLPDDEKATHMLSCVSRGVGRIAIEI